MPRRPVRPSDSATVPRATTLRTLADDLGLSPASISLVLNRAPGAAAIPRATQERIEEAARRLHYRPNNLARTLRGRRSYTIGVLVPEISEGYAALVTSGLEACLLRDGYLYFIASHHHRDDLVDEYPRLLLQRSVDGLVAIDTPCGRAMPVPVVSVPARCRTAGVTTVALDHDEAARLALSHLRQLGHREIAVFRGQPSSSDSQVRWSAIRRAAAAMRMPIDPRLCVELEDERSSPALGQAAARRLLATGRRFTALFAYNDLSAIGAIAELRSRGRQVPDEVSVVGFDDIPSADFQMPGLTTIRQPLREMGELAGRTLVSRIEKGARARTPRLLTVKPELMVRGTTAVRR